MWQDFTFLRYKQFRLSQVYANSYGLDQYKGYQFYSIML